METDRRDEFDKLKQDQENKVCCDCGNTKYKRIANAAPQWASINNGIFICFNCSAVHRAFGAHISSVRSLNMDAWDDKRIAFMQNGGNRKFKAFMASYDLETVLALVKYKTKAADYYRRRVIWMRVCS